MDNVTLIAVQEIREELAGAATLEERVRRAFASAQHCWVTGRDDVRFNAATAAVLLETTDPDDRERVVRTTKVMAAVVAALGNLPIRTDFAGEDLASIMGPYEALPLAAWWQEAKDNG